MKLTNEKVFTSLLALRELMPIELPAVAALRVRKLHKELSEAWKDVEAIKDDLLQRYGQKDEGGKLTTQTTENGDVVVIHPDCRGMFEASWAALLQDEIEVTTVIRAADLGDAKLTPAVLINLGELLED